MFHVLTESEIPRQGGTNESKECVHFKASPFKPRDKIVEIVKIASLGDVRRMLGILVYAPRYAATWRTGDTGVRINAYA